MTNAIMLQLPKAHKSIILPSLGEAYLELVRFPKPTLIRGPQNLNLCHPSYICNTYTTSTDPLNRHFPLRGLLSVGGVLLRSALCNILPPRISRNQ